MVESQTVGRDRLIVIVVDGSYRRFGAEWWWADYYIHRKNIPLGSSRNLAIERGLATGARFLALWDDDDYYTTDHLERMVSELEKNLRYGVAGASMTPLYYLADDVTYVAGPYCENHALEPTLVFRDWYLREGHRFLPKTRGLSAEILEGFATPLLQVWGTIVIMCHGTNTYDKDQIRADPGRFRARAATAVLPEAVVRLLEVEGLVEGHPMRPKETRLPPLSVHLQSSCDDIPDRERPSLTCR